MQWHDAASAYILDYFFSQGNVNKAYLEYIRDNYNNQSIANTIGQIKQTFSIRGFDCQVK